MVSTTDLSKIRTYNLALIGSISTYAIQNSINFQV